ncbi:DUF429 domain-containing protein [Azorhizobium sp. AG788]|uniref:DUF429 domain-containing protein n=1 Tax=Azorhizobium sp. AG788 TaxID=2183897 RepID=UPI0031399246
MDLVREVIGLDGCPGGWVGARWDGGSGLVLERYGNLTAVFAGPTAWLQAAVDMPIGLPEMAGPRGRAPERLVRPLLGMRQSSVFSVPSRAAVEAGGDADGDDATRYQAACRIARATSEPPRAISKQAFNIFPKILEADALLRSRPGLPLAECHPEVSFWAMNGRKPLALPKKVKSTPSPEGMALRIALLAAQGMPVASLTPAQARRLRVGLDDLVDACACAWTALRIARGTAEAFPDPPETDKHGLPVAIWA